MTVNERISEILNFQKEKTQKKLAESIGVATSTVNNWLKLGRSIPAEYIIPISEFLETDVYFLLSGIQPESYQIKDNDMEWLSLIHQLPERAQYEFRGEMKGYLKRLDEEESVAADRDLKQAK